MVPVLNRHYRLQWEPVQEAYVLLYPEGMIKLNHSASEILLACDGNLTFAEICRVLQARYPEVESIHIDIEEFIVGASEQGWLHCDSRQ
nr:pyrroloquinoline quinone biosynthesis peptide chaperone PqqD [Halioxenophilus sp. WMMB6]